MLVFVALLIIAICSGVSGQKSQLDDKGPRVVPHGGSPETLRAHSLAESQCVWDRENAQEDYHKLSASILPSLLRRYTRLQVPLVVMAVPATVKSHNLCFAEKDFLDTVKKEASWKAGIVECGPDDGQWFEPCLSYSDSFVEEAAKEEEEWINRGEDDENKDSGSRKTFLSPVYVVFWNSRMYRLFWDWENSLISMQVKRIMKPVPCIEESAKEIVKYLRHGQKDINGYVVDRKVVFGAFPNGEPRELLSEFKTIAEQSYWRIDLNFVFTTDPSISGVIQKARPEYFKNSHTANSTIVMINTKTELDIDDEISVYGGGKRPLGSWLNKSYISPKVEHYTPFVAELIVKEMPTAYLFLNKSDYQTSKDALQAVKSIASKYLNKLNFFWLDQVEGWPIHKRLGLEGRPFPAMVIKGGYKFGGKVFRFEGDTFASEYVDLFIKRFYRKELVNVREEVDAMYIVQDIIVSRSLNETGVASSAILKEYLRSRKSTLLMLMVYNSSTVTENNEEKLKQFNFLSRFYWRYVPARDTDITIAALDTSKSYLHSDLLPVHLVDHIYFITKASISQVPLATALQESMSFMHVPSDVVKRLENDDLRYLNIDTDI